MKFVAAAVRALSSSIALAQKTAPGDRVYVLHSQAQGTCPALDWHIVATPGGVLSGMLAWPDQKMVARVSGSIVPHVASSPAAPDRATAFVYSAERRTPIGCRTPQPHQPGACGRMVRLTRPAGWRHSAGR